MKSMRWIALALAGLALAPRAGEGQYVLRDDTSGWGWLSFVTDRRAIVQLAHASVETGEQGRIDSALLASLRARGVRRAWEGSAFDATESQVLAECAAVDVSPAGSATVEFGVHAEVSYWDHNRLSATEIYESLSLGSAPRAGFTTDLYVETCSRILSDILFRLGYDEG